MCKNGLDLKLELSELDRQGPGYLGKTIGIIRKRRVLLLHVNISIVILSCRYLGHSGDTVLISNLQFETKSGNK